MGFESKDESVSIVVVGFGERIVFSSDGECSVEKAFGFFASFNILSKTSARV